MQMAQPLAMAQPAMQQQPQGQLMMVQVPGGMQGGMQMQVHTIAGLMNVTIPMGLMPGQTFQVQVPTAPQQPQSIYQPQMQQPQSIYQPQMQQQAPMMMPQPQPQQQTIIINQQAPATIYGGGGHVGVGVGDVMLGMAAGAAIGGMLGDGGDDHGWGGDDHGWGDDCSGWGDDGGWD